jgi:hypothetical protein
MLRRQVSVRTRLIQKMIRVRRVQPPITSAAPSQIDEGTGGSFPGVQPQGYLIDYGREPGYPSRFYVDAGRDRAVSAQFEHQFCGAHDVPSAWCPNCEGPLLRFVAFDTRDARLGLGEVPSGTLSLFYCWRCPAAQGPFSYRVLEDGDISLLQCEPGSPETDFPYSDYPVSFPGARASLLEISEEVQEFFRRFNMGDDIWDHPLRQEDPRLLDCPHQYGGEPLLIQQDTEYRLQCPACQAAMPFLCSIGDDCLDPRGFCGNTSVQVVYHYCSPCRVVRAFQQCD